MKKDGLGRPSFNKDHDSLFDAAVEDWRFVLTSDIAEDGLLPRTPTVLLNDDPYWKPLNQIESVLLDIIRERVGDKKGNKKSRR